MSTDHHSLPFILIVDDNEPVRNSLGAYFEDLGYRVLEAENAQIALHLGEKNALYAAVIDLRLPDMDGLTLVRRLMHSCPQTTFVIYTGSTEFNLPQDLLESPRALSRVFIKPVNMQELSTSLFEWIKKYPPL